MPSAIAVRSTRPEWSELAKRERNGGSLSEAAERSRREEAPPSAKDGAGNGIRTRDFDLGKVALYH